VAILVYQNNEMAPMLVYQENPVVGIENQEICIAADHESKNDL